MTDEAAHAIDPFTNKKKENTARAKIVTSPAVRQKSVLMLSANLVTAALQMFCSRLTAASASVFPSLYASAKLRLDSQACAKQTTCCAHMCGRNTLKYKAISN